MRVAVAATRSFHHMFLGAGLCAVGAPGARRGRL